MTRIPVYGAGLIGADTFRFAVVSRLVEVDRSEVIEAVAGSEVVVGVLAARGLLDLDRVCDPLELAGDVAGGPATLARACPELCDT